MLLAFRNSVNDQPSFPWYGLVGASSPLEQGDLLERFPIPIIPEALADLAPDVQHASLNEPIPVEKFNLIILTQSCDIPKLTLDDELVLCPRYDYPEICKVKQDLSGKGGWSKLVKGHFIGLHIINECQLEGYSFPHQVVDLQRVFTSPLRVVQKHIRNRDRRVRLLPPYREHLGEAFARQFMRVGLPVDLPRDNPYL